MLLGLTLSFFWVAVPAHAAIYACPAEGGGKIFQDRPCDETNPIEKTKNNTSSPTANDKRARPDLPEDMHESWFDRPPLATNHVWCDRSGCECGPLERTFAGGITQAVMDALYLDGGWHRYNTMTVKLKDTVKNSFEYQQLRVDIDVAACDIMMSQNILKRYGDRKLQQIRQAAVVAEQMGYADPTLCDAGQLEACRQLEAYELFELIRADLSALKVARPNTTTRSPLD
jgi:hypothetical protein